MDKLNLEGFDKYVTSSYRDEYNLVTILKFDNGYGATIIGEDSNFSIGVTLWDIGVISINRFDTLEEVIKEIDRISLLPSQKKKKYVIVYVNGLIVDDVEIFDTFEEAKKAFKDYTGLEYDAIYGEKGDYEVLLKKNEEVDQTKIFEVEI